MRPEEVIVSNEEGGKGDSPSGGVKTMRWPDMVFVGSHQAFYELLKGSKLC